MLGKVCFFCVFKVETGIYLLLLLRFMRICLNLIDPWTQNFRFCISLEHDPPLAKTKVEMALDKEITSCFY